MVTGRDIYKNRDKALARDVFKAFIPTSVSCQLDFDTLVPQKQTYVSEAHKHREFDLIYQTRYQENEAFLYLLVEHQSTPDPLMPLL